MRVKRGRDINRKVMELSDIAPRGKSVKKITLK